VPLHRDVIAGTLFVLIGAAALILGRRYPIGTAMHMGPGYFPAVLGTVLMLLGAWIGLRAFRRRDWTAVGWGWKPLAWIVASMLSFGFVMPRFGLIPALALMFPLAAAAGREFAFREVLLITVLMCVAAAGIFVYGLKLPYRLFAF
jgi:hypothetical protein